MKVLVTGASGFIGGAVVRALAAADVAVRITARPGNDLRHLTGLSIERVEADLRDKKSLVLETRQRPASSHRPLNRAG
ncbi:MAG TPA: NAD-dependent epimerase/dehydratase family protein [Nitrospiraceae bacterium]|nr:NAD-dependent epimerase/dehydratase family protein [Nitrospiraceae bacterium]